MKRLLISAAALTLLGAPAAFAQQDQDHHDRDQHQGGGQWQGHGASGNSSGGQQQQQQQSSHQSGGSAGGASHTSQPQGGGRPDWNAYYRSNPDLQKAYRQNQQSSTYHESVDAFAERHYREHGQTEGRSLPTLQGQQYPQGQGGWQGRGGNDNRYQGQGQGQQRWQGGDRGGARDYRSFQRNTFAQHRYRLPAFRWPRGFEYRRFTFGQYLPRAFFGQDYWLYDYSDYGLPYPPPGTAWVRYGPDALLIDRESGEIVQVIYGVFY